MNWMLTEIPRGSLSSSVPLVRMGTEYKKKHTVHRLFDHIALSILWGEGMKVRLEDQYRTEEYSEPVCVIALPGDNRKMIPLEPFNEIFFVYGASMLQKVLPNLPDDPALFERVIPLKNVPTAFPLIHAFESLIHQELSPGFAGQMDLLASALLSATFRSPRKNISREEKLMALFQSHIQLHYREDIDWEAMARQYGVGFQTFRKIWKAHSEIPPHRFVMELRSRDACYLLEDLSLPVQEIADMLGFPDLCYFSRFFRKMNGISPSEYRNGCRKNMISHLSGSKNK